MEPQAESMKTIIIARFGSPESFVMKVIPIPEPNTGEALIQIKAFGVNHAEMHMQKGEGAERGEFKQGTPVASLMGGLGRIMNGSYAQFTKARVSNTCLLRNLNLMSGQRLLIRGATSAFGQAALYLAVDKGAHVSATSRNASCFALLQSLGAGSTAIEGPELSARLPERFDAILDLVGNSTIVESLNMVRRDGRVRLAGFLGVLAPIQGFNPLLQVASGVHFSFFESFVFGTPGVPCQMFPCKRLSK
ncbi:uncharacterized protein BO80DRAFT_503273 [Aspergillus ibericus CBS 121593]|uniref:Alcohol dehydrogenase-like C-terminal domain-containing protein n=1 Tax=Aspergillus ibericus CBS 121593 TaxID=1448316 RepID=A0A395GWP2_9EURO|nr:hypothetical protein BO80DRAFT_503273 [Aspergillus ibericus CBS 121593]RAK99514.1 hypothetical protein BO80DRAFT_503273 [Aspergillus ibericus CBS 121593]